MAATFALLGAIAAPPAPALDLGPVVIDIAVNTTDWSACGIVQDDLTNARYTAVLTATGYESTGLAQNGVLLGQATATGNPARPCTPGGFDSRFAVVQYTLTWTSVLGTTGTMTKTCAEADLRRAIQPPATIDADVAMPICTVS